MTPEGVRIELKGARDHERTQVGDEEAVLRESAHEALREPRGSWKASAAGSRPGPATLSEHLEMTQRARKTESPLAGVRTAEGPPGASAIVFAAVALRSAAWGPGR